LAQKTAFLKTETRKTPLRRIASQWGVVYVNNDGTAAQDPVPVAGPTGNPA